MIGLERSKAITEIIKGIVEIIALIIAGLWAFSNFQKTEVPSLESRAYSESVMQWFPSTDPKHCMGSFGVKIKNIGKKSIDLDRALLRVWIINEPHFDKGMTFIDPELFQAEKASYEKSFILNQDVSGLLGHFPPDTDGQTDFTFSFEKKSLKIALFSFVADGPEVHIRQRRWSYVCDLP
jgi:hypothetical protein